MHDSEYTGPTWPTFFVTPDQLEAAMAHPDYSTFVPVRDKTRCIDGYLVTFGNASGPVPAIEPLLLSQKGSIFLTRPTLMAYTATRDELELSAHALIDVVAKGTRGRELITTLCAAGLQIERVKCGSLCRRAPHGGVCGAGPQRVALLVGQDAEHIEKAVRARRDPR